MENVKYTRELSNMGPLPKLVNKVNGDVKK